MFYFIPSWYNQDRKWYDSTPLWFRVFERMEFDDTINQIKMFRHSDEETCLLLLNYNPNLRYFLHKYDLLESDYWSFFDEIQNISRVETHPIEFKALNWPPGSHFIYTPFAVIVQQDNKVIAMVQFAESGNLLYVDFENDGKVTKRYLFDDRGFLSSIIYYDEDAEASHQDYLNENGVWQVREHFKKKQGIEINPFSDHQFSHRFYKDWEELILEFLQLLQKNRLINVTDSMIIATHEQHNHLLIEAFPNLKKVFSFFNNRFDLKSEQLKEVVDAADLLVVDTKESEEELVAEMESRHLAAKAISKISPFDTRLRLGHSQMIKESIIYFMVDDMEEPELRSYVFSVLDFMNSHPSVDLLLVSYQHNFNINKLQREVTNMIVSNFEVENFFQMESLKGENKLEEEAVLKRISIEIFSNENQVISALDKVRLVVDVRDIPDLYTQIASISAGVPQLNIVRTEYVSHKKNGWVLSDINELPNVLSYYLEGLRNWNQSLIYAVQKMNDYTSGQLVNEWKKQLENN